MQARIVVLAGDGIGPEVTNEAKKILNVVAGKFGHAFEFDHQLMGGCAIDLKGTSLPEETVQASLAADAVLLGAVGGPKWDVPTAPDRPERGLLAIRKALNLFANLRPVKLSRQLISSSTIKESVLEGTDMVVIRELTGGAYFGPRKEAGAEAYEAYDEFLKTYPDAMGRGAKALAEKRVKELDAKTGALTILVNEGGADVSLDDKKIGASPVRALIRVGTGAHSLKVSKAGFAAFEKSVDVAPGAKVSVDVNLVKGAKTGKLTVKVAKDGFRPASAKLNVRK